MPTFDINPNSNSSVFSLYRNPSQTSSSSNQAEQAWDRLRQNQKSAQVNPINQSSPANSPSTLDSSITNIKSILDPSSGSEQTTKLRTLLNDDRLVNFYKEKKFTSLVNSEKQLSYAEALQEVKFLEEKLVKDGAVEGFDAASLADKKYKIIHQFQEGERERVLNISGDIKTYNAYNQLQQSILSHASLANSDSAKYLDQITKDMGRLTDGLKVNPYKQTLEVLHAQLPSSRKADVFNDNTWAQDSTVLDEVSKAATSYSGSENHSDFKLKTGTRALNSVLRPGGGVQSPIGASTVAWATTAALVGAGIFAAVNFWNPFGWATAAGLATTAVGTAGAVTAGLTAGALTGAAAGTAIAAVKDDEVRDGASGLLQPFKSWGDALTS
jgi:hypothetical protein